MSRTTRRSLLKTGMATVATVPVAGCLGVTDDEDYPDDTITIIVPYDEGGGTDTEARALAPGLSEELDVTIQVDNVPGSGGIRGLDEAMRSDADGYTICAILPPANGIIQSYLGDQDAPVDFENEVNTLCGYSVSPYIIYSHSDLEIEDLDGMLDRYEDGEFDSVGVGSPGSVPWTQAVEMQLNEMDWQWQEIIPYGGSGPTNQAVVGGEVPVGIVVPNSIVDFVEEGQLDPIAHTASSGSQTFPDVDAITDYGYPNIDTIAELLRGFAVPPDTPEERMETFCDALESALQRDDIQQWGEDTGTELEYIPHDEYAERYAEAVEGLPDAIDLDRHREYLE